MASIQPIIDALGDAQEAGMAGIEAGASRLQQLTGYMQGLGALEPTSLKTTAAQWAKDQASAALGNMFAPVDCIPFTPFTPNIGQAGRGHARFLSAPDVVAAMTDAIASSDAGGNILAVLFTAASHEALADSLAAFNTLLPLPDLVRTERRSGQLARLEREKWTIPTTRPGAFWRQLSPDTCTVTKAANAAVAKLLAPIESDAAYLDDITLLGDLVQQKQQLLNKTGDALDALKKQLANVSGTTSIRAAFLEADTTDSMVKAFKRLESPGYEFTVCAGVLFKGGGQSLDFIKDLLSL